MVRDFDFPENEHFRNKNSVLCVLRNAKSKKKKKINIGILFQKKGKDTTFYFYTRFYFQNSKQKIKKKNTNSSLRFLFFFARNVWKYFHKTCNQTATSHLQIVRGKFIEIKISLSETKKKKHSPSRPHCWKNHFILHRIL